MIGKELSPFQAWCHKTLPLVYEDSLSYYEYLCKVTEYLNQILEQMNVLTASEEQFQVTMTDNWNTYKTGLTGEWTTYKTNLTKDWEEYKTALNAIWLQYKNYIDNYFTNLNVQQEINTKLDKMASDGTLSLLIQPLFDNYKEQINVIVESQNGKIAVLESRMNSFTTLPNGSTTGDAELIDARVGTNGKTYANAGSAIRGQIDKLNYYRDNTKNILLLDDITIGMIISGSGVETANADYNTTWYIPIEASMQYIFSVNGLASNFVVWSYYTADKTFISRNALVSSVTTPSNAAYVRFSLLINTGIDFTAAQAEKGTVITSFAYPKDIANLEIINTIKQYQSKATLNNAYVTMTETVDFDEVDGIYANGDITTFSENTAWKSTLIDCEGGEIYRICGSVSGITNYLFAFADISNKTLLRDGVGVAGQTIYKDIIVTAPSNASKLLITVNKESAIDLRKYAVVKNNADAKYGYSEIKLRPQNGTISTSLGLNAGIGYHGVYRNVTEGEKYRVTGYNFNGSFPVCIFASNNSYISSVQILPSDSKVINYEVIVPSGATQMIINAYSKNYCSVGKYGVLEPNEPDSYWTGKKIAWFGTSIPAGSVDYSYPCTIGIKLGATVFNESVGSSCARSGVHSYVSETDTMGYAGMDAVSLMRSLSLSSTEKQSIFDNWSTWSPLLTHSSSIDTGNQSYYLNTSWDVKLNRYLTGGAVGQCDLYVFDHGRNDEDVTNSWSDLADEPPVNDKSNRSYFIGAMNFLIGKILADNPKARILIIGHYETDRCVGCTDGQEKLASEWGYPLIKTWEKVGFSQRSITSKGVTKTITQFWMPDDLHPHSDTTGDAIAHYVSALLPWFKNNSPD